MHERVGRSASAGIQDRDPLEQLADELAGLGLGRCHLPGFGRVGDAGQVAQFAFQHVAPGGQVIPAAPPLVLGLGVMMATSPLHQIAPVLDLPRVSFAHQEDNGRGVGRAVVRQPLLPVGVQQAALRGDRADVVGQRQRDDIRLQTVDHRSGLLARSSVRLVDGHLLAGLLSSSTLRTKR